MRHVIYVDLIFIIEVVINYVLICFVGKIIKLKATSLRKIFSAVLGAVVTIICYLYIRNIFCIILIRYIFENAITMYISYRIKCKKGYIKAVVMGMAMALFVNGCINYLYLNTYIGLMVGNFVNEVSYSNKGMMKFIGISLITYVFLETIIEFVVKKSNDNVGEITGIYYIVIKYDAYELKVRGIYDSGNTLINPFDKKDIYIVEKSIANEIYKWKNIVNSLIYVPYNSVNGKGTLPTVLVDKIMVYDEFDNLVKELDNTRIGFSKNKISENGEFQMILNRGLFSTTDRITKIVK